MITKQELRQKHGEDIFFLFKGDEPFMTDESNKPLGVLLEKNGKILCYECEKWFKILSTHVTRTHDMTSDEYRIKYGYNKNVGLCSKKVSNQRRRFALKNKSLLSIGKKTRFNKSNNAYKKRVLSMQTKNVKNTCPEQMKHRLSLLVAKYGNSLTAIQVHETDSGVVWWAQQKYGSWKKMKKAFNLNNYYAPKNKKKDADLIYDLREYVSNFNQLPWTKDGKNSEFPHHASSYYFRWGSRRKAMAHCGIKKIKIDNKYKWIVIN